MASSGRYSGSKSSTWCIRGLVLSVRPQTRAFLRQKYRRLGASLVAPWERICLPEQETQVQSLIREDPTCRATTKPTCHSY